MVTVLYDSNKQLLHVKYPSLVHITFTFLQSHLIFFHPGAQSFTVLYHCSYSAILDPPLPLTEKVGNAENVPTHAEGFYGA